MRRWATLGATSLLALTGCPRPQPPALDGGPEPELRIGLGVGLREVPLGGDAGGELFVTDDGNGQPVGSIPAGVTWIAVADSGGLQLVRPDGTRTEAHRGISAVNVTEGRFAMVLGRRYRGRVNIVRGIGGLTVMNRVPVESYVAGVVNAEIGPRRPDEAAAVPVQAVVSRTYALRNRGRWESLGFDGWSDVRDQVYFGVGGETPQAWDAVRRTAGQVVRYRGELIDAYFHSTCGFRTAAADEAFKTGQPRPYLRSVSDASGGGHYYCDISPRFRWREEWDGQKLRAILSRTLPAVMNVGGDGLQRITNVEVSRTTRSGRVGELRIVFDHGDVRVPGPDVRSVLRAEADRQLQSAAFQLSVSTAGGGAGTGEVTRLVALGAGAGHGVGLCQWGAIGRARAGQEYRRILETYYEGTKVEKLY